MNFFKHLFSFFLFIGLALADGTIYAQNYSSANFRLVTDLSSISENKLYAFIASDADNYYLMTNTIRTKSSSKDALVAKVIEKKTNINLSKDAFFSLKKYSDGHVTITAYSYEDSKVLFHQDDKGSLKYTESTNWSNSFYLRPKANDNDSLAVYTSTNDNTSSRYLACSVSKDDSYFKTYSSKGYLYAYLYEYIADTLSVRTAEGYGTYYSDIPFVMPDGLQGAFVNKYGDLNLGLNWVYKGGDVVPANTALLLYGEKEDYPAHAANEKKISKTEEVATNYLMGTTTASETVAPNNGDVADYKFYKMYYFSDTETQQKTLGFYWGEENGGVFKNGAKKAYLALPNVLSQSVSVGFSLPTMPETGIALPKIEQNIENVAISEGFAVYNIAGQRMNAKNANELPKGIYIINGKKIVK